METTKVVLRPKPQKGEVLSLWLWSGYFSSMLVLEAFCWMPEIPLRCCLENSWRSATTTRGDERAYDTPISRYPDCFRSRSLCSLLVWWALPDGLAGWPVSAPSATSWPSPRSMQEPTPPGSTPLTAWSPFPALDLGSGRQHFYARREADSRHLDVG